MLLYTPESVPMLTAGTSGFPPEVAGVRYLDSDSVHVLRVLNIFKLENPTPVQIRATVHSTEIQQCLHFSNDVYTDHADSCYYLK